jgi:hypothetical protein
MIQNIQNTLPQNIVHKVVCKYTIHFYRFISMLRLLNFSFNGDIHCFFLLQTSMSAIHRFCLPIPFRLRKHKGHDLSYDVKIMTSQQRLSRIVRSTFL